MQDHFNFLDFNLDLGKIECKINSRFAMSIRLHLQFNENLCTFFFFSKGERTNMTKGIQPLCCGKEELFQNTRVSKCF